jgi:hypothetical protein
LLTKFRLQVLVERFRPRRKNEARLEVDLERSDRVASGAPLSPDRWERRVNGERKNDGLQ